MKATYPASPQEALNELQQRNNTVRYAFWKNGLKKLHLCREDEGKGKIIGMLQGVDNSDGEESQGPKL